MLTDFETFMQDVGFDRIFRMTELRGLDNCTMLETEGKYPTFIKIIDAIELPDKDILIGYRAIFSWDEYMDSESFDNEPIRYVKMSEIRLSFFPSDMKEESWR